MPENKSINANQGTFAEKFVRRVLTSIGGSVDRVFGRSTKKNELPSTSDLSERLRRLIDNQAQVNKDGRKLAPHFIYLRYSWGQSSDEFLAALKGLKNELLVVALEHLNDNRYATLSPVKVEAKADILTQGFTLSVGFDEADAFSSEQVQVPVEIFAKLLPPEHFEKPALPGVIAVDASVTLPNGNQKKSVLHFVQSEKTALSVGRIKENHLFLDDESVSKHHASLVMDAAGILRVADIGSTNGTFLNGERIAYGKSYEVKLNDKVGFGDVIVSFAWEFVQQTPVQTLNGAESVSSEQFHVSSKEVIKQPNDLKNQNSTLENSKTAFSNEEITIVEGRSNSLAQAKKPLDDSSKNFDVETEKPSDFTLSLPQVASQPSVSTDISNDSK
jgi:pSer/pThr/pTyr-binding forkhead associated (FHA) protein